LKAIAKQFLEGEFYELRLSGILARDHRRGPFLALFALLSGKEFSGRWASERPTLTFFDLLR
jgi:hypothetical protein